MANSRVVAQGTFQVGSVNWKDHLKRLRLDPGPKWIDVPLSACVTTGDQVRLSRDGAWVICKNGDCQLLDPYVVSDVLHIGGTDLPVLVKEITEPDEHAAYRSLADYHYRGHSIHGRTARLVVRAFHPSYPKVIGYIELATPFFMNKPRSAVLDAPFKYRDISWERWDLATLRKYIHLVVRVARTVVAPEFRGAGIGQMLVSHAARFAQSRWQVAGYLPYFLEISADMLKFVPFAERAGMVYVGETEGNLRRVAKDMRYLIGRFRDDGQGKTKFEEISGILDQQIARMDRSLQLMEREGIDVEELIDRLKRLSKGTVLRQLDLFQGIVSLPKPHYMLGLYPETSRFLESRVKQLCISNGNTHNDVTLTPLCGAIRVRDLSVTYTSRVRRTLRTHAVQQAFDISPEDIHSTVLRDLNVTIGPGEVILVLGPSGSGKSTLIETFLHASTTNRAARTGEVDVPANFMPATFEPIRSKKPLIELIGSSDVGSGLRLLGLAGLSEAVVYLKRFEELSRGQQYRAMLARLIASGANVWLADDFCTNLDPATASVVADSVQRVAHRVGATFIAAAPHCETFIESLKPDTVVLLSSNWDHSVISGSEYIREIRGGQGSDGRLPRLRVLPEMIGAIKDGSKCATVRKGRRLLKPGLLLLSDGRESVAVRVTSVTCKWFCRLSDSDASAEGMHNAEALKGAVKSIYPDLRDRSLVTVIRFERLWREVQPRSSSNANA